MESDNKLYAYIYFCYSMSYCFLSCYTIVRYSHVLWFVNFMIFIQLYIALYLSLIHISFQCFDHFQVLNHNLGVSHAWHDVTSSSLASKHDKVDFILFLSLYIKGETIFQPERYPVCSKNKLYVKQYNLCYYHGYINITKLIYNLLSTITGLLQWKLS